MTSDTLHHAVRAQPFQPFVLHLADGRKVSVDHPEVIAYRQGGRTAVAMLANDAFEFIDLLLVVSLEVKPPRTGTRRPRNTG